MPTRLSGFALLLVTLGAFAASGPSAPPPVAPGLLAGLVWRNLGPFRGGRISAVSGAIGQPGVFYIGLPAGGVWKTTSAGETWTPIFDAITAASRVGAVEVAPSDPNGDHAGLADGAGDGRDAPAAERPEVAPDETGEEAGSDGRRGGGIGSGECAECDQQQCEAGEPERHGRTRELWGWRHIIIQRHPLDRPNLVT